ncbi:MAG TPA: DUF1232 domain-containing protein [Spirochaetota bacterium]|nr:DUF1232 domain-containing protein [Spirochaetota bacterium]HPC40332.1 DUF1232 domain-containing protein [Spirochaetota bacterium]HPL16121.1 DUF1232 domain-containing protein [Spirochaetota bacterium]HQF07193.1 DUF1232 domain-containing protein [Spirochaetota bacterium]HQH96092.1 DUF1232 domain-containing protein [Spirochaetota bacterium]
MSLASSLKQKAAALKKELSALYYAYRHPRTGMAPRLIILFTLGYALSPLDLIPDFIPVIGHLDDLIIIPLLISLSVRLIPPEVMIECREKAATNPATLKKDWKFAAGIIFVWVCIIIIIIRNVI